MFGLDRVSSRTRENGCSIRHPRKAERSISRCVCRRSRWRSEEHTSELQSQSNLVCRLLLEKKKINNPAIDSPSATLYASEPLALERLPTITVIKSDTVSHVLYAREWSHLPLPPLHLAFIFT